MGDPSCLLAARLYGERKSADAQSRLQGVAGAREMTKSSTKETGTMSLLTENIQETNPADALGFCSATGASLRLDRQATMTETMEPSRFDQRRLTEKLERFLLTRPQPPFLAVDLDVIQAKYRELCQSFPTASVYYAMKANPASEVVTLLASMGASFDIASPSELDLCLELGAHPSRLSYGNTIKKAADIEYAFRRGVRRFAFDSEAELRKLGQYARGAAVMCRLQTTGENAGWPLSRKFGCDLEMAAELLLMARNLGLRAIGLAFHVGSQQTDPTQWRKPLRETAGLFRKLARQGTTLDTVNIGGGFPVPYEDNVPSVRQFSDAIAEAMDDAFGASAPKLMLEPGRSLVAEAGVIQSEVVLVSRKSRSDQMRWVYLDVGKFGGLAETLDESIKYRLRTTRTGAPGPVVLAGPTCDSADILYEKAGYHLPLDLECGDRIEILNTGAYTSSYASVGFNGFGPLRTVCL
jgi:ornithine decarboxylase